MRLFLHHLRGEQRLFWRSRELAFFTFALPLILFVLLGSVYGDDKIEGVTGHEYLLAGMLGYGAAATTFAGLSIVLVIRREEGILKRLRATPLPAPTLIAAYLTSTLIVFAIEAVLLYAFGALFFDIAFPHRLFSLVLSLALGALAFTALGLALTTFVRSGEGSSAVVNAIYLPMTFISGAFWSPSRFPEVLEKIADVLPLTYLIELVKDVAVGGSQIWDEGVAVAVVAGWGLAGVVVAALRFRWEPRDR
jgi:ABC-2 type transport system permease protein